MYKKILIAVDLAGEADVVLQKGKALAEVFGASCHAIYCVEQPITPFGELSVPQPMLDVVQLKQDLLPQFKKVATEAGFPEADVSVEIGHVVDVIVDTAEEDGYDLIVIGSHGRHGVRLLLGSTANAVLHHAKCDVMALRIKE